MSKKPPAPADPQSEALRASLDALAPIVSVCIEAGVSYHDLAHLLRQSFVREATGRLRGGAGRVTASRIAAATGLTRADVRKLLRTPPETVLAERSLPRSVDSVIAGWFSDPDFLDEYGNPRALSYSDTRLGFPELARRYSRDIPPRALLSELSDSNLVSEIEKDVFAPTHSTSQFTRFPRDAMLEFGFKVNALGKTLQQNLDPGTKRKLFERIVLAENIAPNRTAKVTRDLGRRCQTFAQSLERYLLDQSNTAPACADVTDSESIGVLVAIVRKPPPEST